jgi:uncharacterized membrane protein YccC
VGFCLYIALLERTPRSYVFMLAGYTAALIGFPAVTTPGDIWPIALARVEEIWLGIICTTVIGTVAFPRELGPMLSARILAWVGNAFNWTEDVLAGEPDLDKRQGHIQLAADAVELRLLGMQLAYDTSRFQVATRWVMELQKRMVLLLPLLSSINDRLGALRQAGGVTPRLTWLLDDMRVWVRAGDPPPRSEADRIRASIAHCQAEIDPRAGWNDIMRCSVLQRLGQLVDLRQDMRDLRDHIQRGGGTLPQPLTVHVHAQEHLHRDRGLALLSALAATVAVLLICAFWIGTGWASGGGAAALTAAACCLFATLDDPTPALKGMLLSVVIAAVAVGIGLFAILPVVHDFEILTLVLAAFFVPVGLLIAMPATQVLGTPLGFLTATLLSLQSAYSADFVAYADGSFAAILGVATAAVVTALMRSVGAEWSARRLLRANWRDLAAIPSHHEPHQRGALSALLLDRLGLLVPRLAVIGAANELAAADVLADLRIGINMIDLQHDREAMAPAVRAAVDEVVAGTARHFETQAAVGRVRSPSPALLGCIDRALDVTVALEGRADLLLQLVGIRRGLFADAEPFRPTPPPVRQAA